MKPNIKRYDVFISYRREGGEETAKHLRDTLTERGYRVFLDVESLRSGPFNEALYQVIDHSKDFLLILPPDALDRCVNEGDWVRKEIEHAKAANKNIIPIMLKGFSFPEDLPESIDFIRYQNAPPTFEVTFFDAFVDKLQTFMISKRKSRTKRTILLAIVALLLVAIGYGVYYFNYTYPLTTRDKNVVSELITYLTSNLKQMDLAGQNYVKEVNRAQQYVEEKTTDTVGTIQLEITNYINILEEQRASLTDIPDQLREDLKGNKRFSLGELAAFKTTLYDMIDSYIDSLEHIRDFIISESNLRSETHLIYLNMLLGTAQLDGEILFYNLNETLLPVTNQSALETLKNKILPEMSFIYAKRLDLTNDKEALSGKQDAVYLQYNKLIDSYAEALERENNYTDPEETLQSLEYLISYRESHGMDASDLVALKESIETKIAKLEENKLAIVETEKQIQQLKEEAYEKFKPSQDDSPETLWGKAKRFLTINMPEAAVECFDLFIEKSDGDDQLAAISGKRFAQVCTSLGLKGGVIVGMYEENLPHQAVEIGDVIFEVDGNTIRNHTQYTEAIAEKGVHSIRLIRFGSMNYEIIDSVIDTSLGRIGLYSLNDEAIQSEEKQE